MKWVAAAGIILAAAAGGSGCSTTAAPVEPEPCASGEGHWIEDDNDWLTAKTHVTVRLCVSDSGAVLDMEVD